MAQININDFIDSNGNVKASKKLITDIVDSNNSIDTRLLNPSVTPYSTTTSGNWRGIVSSSGFPSQGVYLAIVTITSSSGNLLWSGTIPMTVGTDKKQILLANSNNLTVSGIGYFRIEPNDRFWLQLYTSDTTVITHCKVV